MKEFHIAPPDSLYKNADWTGVMEALKGLKNLRLQGSLREPAIVWCHGGTYRIAKIIEITSELAMPVTFKAAPGETPVFDAGIYLNGWEETSVNGHNVLKAIMPDDAIRESRIDQLFINGRRKKVAAFPKSFEGFEIQRPLDGAGRNLFDGAEGFIAKPGDFNPEWHDIQGIDIVLFQKWIENHLPVKQFDAATGKLTFKCLSRFAIDTSSRYICTNVREALAEPGEYYFDRIGKTLFYYPEESENASNIEAVVPGIPSIIVIAGGEQQVSWMAFEGLTFKYAGGDRPITKTYYDFSGKSDLLIPNYLVKVGWDASGNKNPHSSPQGAIHLTAAFMMTGAHDCSISNCSFQHCGTNAIEIAEACSEIAITSNRISDMGGGGVYISGYNKADGNCKKWTHRITVSNNEIAFCGQFYHSAIGVCIGHAFGNLVEHNDIHDLYYSGISCGWVWGYADSVTRENRIGYNRIHDIGKHVLCDMGGIYMLGIQPGSRIYNNFVSNVACRNYGGWGIYTDEGSAHIVIEKNICTDCSKEGFHQHYGRENIARWNIAAFPGEAGIAISVGNWQSLGFTFTGKNYTANYNIFANVIVVDDKPFFKSSNPKAVSQEQLFSDCNCFFNTAGGTSGAFLKAYVNDGINPPAFKDFSLEYWRSLSHDLASICEDPGFVDCEKRDFHLKEDSILRKRGFPDTSDTMEHAGIATVEPTP